MTICIRCHRPLKRETETGMGDTCARKSKAQPVPAHERDLFGYDIDRAVHAALFRVHLRIAVMAAAARMAVIHDCAAARRALGVWT